MARLSDNVLRAGRLVWRGLAPRSARRFAQPLLLKYYQHRVHAALAGPADTLRPGPLLVSGLLSETKGVSEAARLTLAGLRHAGFRPIEHDLGGLLRAGPNGTQGLPMAAPGGVWIIHVNAPEAVHALGLLDPSSWRARYRIGYWAYELPRIPASWARAAAAFHEIWAPSRFVADAITAAGVSTPVRVMPHPVALGGSAAPDRARWSVAAEAFAVIASGDLRSSANRKNLAGAVRIYLRAFPKTGTSRLILKLQSTDFDPASKAELDAVTIGRSDIAVISEALSTAMMRGLIASCDVLLSPHRSEGFGLQLAEAMLAGKPALATGWSGNLDFMEGASQLLIRYKLVPVRDTAGIYQAPGLMWAEPDEDDAVAKLRLLAESAERRKELASLGAQAIKGQLVAWSSSELSKTGLGQWVSL